MNDTQQTFTTKQIMKTETKTMKVTYPVFEGYKFTGEIRQAKKGDYVRLHGNGYLSMWTCEVFSKQEFLIYKKPTEDDLVGKFCKMWDGDEGECVFSIVSRFNGCNSYPYMASSGCNRIYHKNARLATIEEIAELLQRNQL